MPLRHNDPMPFERLGLWPLRVLWAALPVLAGWGLADAIAQRSGPVSATVEIGLWLGWFAGLVALLAPSTVSLTTIRILAPAGLAAAVIAAASAGVWTATTVAAIAGTGVAFGLSLLPMMGDILINGSSYGPERRMALRPPAALLLGPIQAMWLVTVLGATAGPLLLAAGNWLVGIPLLVVGLPAAWAAARRLHQLSRRWVVFVPAGFVLHDHWSMAESLLMQRRQIDQLGPSPLDKGELLDLTGGAAGLALMAQLNESMPLALRARREIQTFSAHRIVFTPSLPGELLREARIRGITIGSD